MKFLARVPFLLAAGFAAVSAAHADDGYLQADSGRAVRTVDGACWRTGAWTASSAHAAHSECDPQTVANIHIAERIVFVFAPVETAPQVEPQPAPQPVVVIERVVVETDALFDFDHAELRPRGMQRLDGLAAQLTGARLVEWVKVVGHADRLGSPGYNQVLSERRAQAVASYLVSQGVDAALIRAEGRGENNPVTSAAACADRPGGPALISCLQPDRRVEIEAAIGMQRVVEVQP